MPSAVISLFVWVFIVSIKRAFTFFGRINWFIYQTERPISRKKRIDILKKNCFRLKIICNISPKLPKIKLTPSWTYHFGTLCCLPFGEPPVFLQKFLKSFCILLHRKIIKHNVINFPITEFF